MKIFNINNVQTIAQIHAKQNQTAENPAKQKLERRFLAELTKPEADTVSFKRIDFDERKINKTIDAFLNNPYANITQAQEISIENALNNCIDMIEYIKDKDKF